MPDKEALDVLQNAITNLRELAKMGAILPQPDLSELSAKLALATDYLDGLPAEDNTLAWTAMRDCAYKDEVQSTAIINAALTDRRRAILEGVTCANELLKSVEQESDVARILRAALIICDDDLSSTTPYDIRMVPESVESFCRKTILRARANVVSLRRQVCIAELSLIPERAREQSFSSVLRLINT